MAEKLQNSFVLLATEIGRRLARPLNQFSFCASVLLGLFLVGPMGIWLEYAKFRMHVGGTLQGIGLGLHTYFPAIATTALLQIVLTGAAKPLKTFAIFASVVLFFLGFFFLAFSSSISPEVSIKWGLGATFISAFLWWIANADEVAFHDVEPDSAVGGNPAAPLNGSVGTLKI